MKRTLLPLIVLTLLAGGFYYFQSSTQAQAQAAWTKKCNEEIKKCWIEQRLYIQQGGEGKDAKSGQLLNVSIIEPNKDDGLPVLLLSMPLGIDLQAGMVMRIDENEQMKAPIQQCTNSGCQVTSAITNDLLKQLRKGNKLQVGFRPFGAEKPFVVDVTLSGFSKAYKSLL